MTINSLESISVHNLIESVWLPRQTQLKCEMCPTLIKKY
jgi:hypothetical protein